MQPVKPDFSKLSPIAKNKTAKGKVYEVQPEQVETQAEQQQGIVPAEPGEVLEPLVIHDPEQLRANATTHSEETKDRAIQQVMAGRTIISVAREMGIDRNTIGAWLAEYKEVREQQSEVHDLKQIDLLEGVSEQLLLSIDKAKMAKASVRDIGIAYGILRDKLKDIRGPKQGHNSTRLRVAWKGGEGAIEVKQD